MTGGGAALGHRPRVSQQTTLNLSLKPAAQWTSVTRPLSGAGRRADALAVRASTAFSICMCRPRAMNYGAGRAWLCEVRAVPAVAGGSGLRAKTAIIAAVHVIAAVQRLRGAATLIAAATARLCVLLWASDSHAAAVA